MNKKPSKAVQNKSIPQAEFEVLSYKLAPSQARLFLYLIEHKTANTIDLRNKISIGNISDIAISLNKKLKLNGDHRRIICSMEVHINQFKQKGLIGHWLLVGSGAANDATNSEIN